MRILHKTEIVMECLHRFCALPRFKHALSAEMPRKGTEKQQERNTLSEIAGSECIQKCLRVGKNECPSCLTQRPTTVFRILRWAFESGLRRCRANTIKSVLESHVTVASRWNSHTSESDWERPSSERIDRSDPRALAPEPAPGPKLRRETPRRLYLWSIFGVS